MHYGVVHYGTDAGELGQTAKSPIRLNPGHPDTVFRVRMDGLKPGTTYFYTVSSMGAEANDDGVSSIKHFTAPSWRKVTSLAGTRGSRAAIRHRQEAADYAHNAAVARLLAGGNK